MWNVQLDNAGLRQVLEWLGPGPIIFPLCLAMKSRFTNGDFERQLSSLKTESSISQRQARPGGFYRLLVLSKLLSPLPYFQTVSRTHLDTPSRSSQRTECEFMLPFVLNLLNAVTFSFGLNFLEHQYSFHLICFPCFLHRLSLDFCKPPITAQEAWWCLVCVRYSAKTKIQPGRVHALLCLYS
jgi:hypothetical protein